MPLRNGEHGYGAVTKTLHWLTFLVVVAQFVVGFTMAFDDSELDRRDDACEATVDSDAAEAEEERCEEQVEREEEAAEDQPSGLHIGLGVAILVLASLRVLWRAYTPLPPWSERYGRGSRTLQWALEKAMLTLLFVVPISGLLLHRGDVGLAVHVSSQVALLVTTSVHIVLQVAHRHLGRMV